MKLTTYTDYTLRVMIFLAQRYTTGARSTIPEIARAYDISHSHLTKIVHELGLHGLIHTVQGRSGGISLARAPADISIGEIVRFSERDFALVECHEAGKETLCTISPVCTLKRGFRKAINAFLAELDEISLAESVSSHTGAVRLLSAAASQKAVIPIVKDSAGSKAALKKPRAPRQRLAG